MARGNPPVRTGIGSPVGDAPGRTGGLTGDGGIAPADAPVAEPWGDPGADRIVDLTGLADDARAARLHELVAGGEPLDARVVVIFAGDYLDEVAAALLGTEVQLLCAPTALEHAGAIALARAVTRPKVGEPPRPEAARLAAIAEEVARIAEALSGLAAREVSGGTGLADRRIGFDMAAAGAIPVTAAQIRGTIRSRRMRDAVFGAGWFEEPAWDMLLDLFAAELEQSRVSVSSLCIAAAVAQTTALRWISKMIVAGLLERRDDETDRRRAFVTMSERTSANMRTYFGALQRAGLGIA